MVYVYKRHSILSFRFISKSVMNMDIQFDQSQKPETTSAEWYTDHFLCESLMTYLRSNGYKVHKDGVEKNGEIVENKIIASRFFTKEIIEIKGIATHHHLDNIAGPHGRLQNNAGHAKHSFSEALFNSFINFGKYYSNDSAEVAMAVPNVPRYNAIVAKVQDYFTINDLHFKLYLVNEDGSVEVSNLNENWAKEKQ
jgi:hypothetical protein